MEARRRSTLIVATGLGLGLGLVSGARAVVAAPPASEVASLRVEVDELAQRLREVRTDVREDLATLRAEKAELERRLRLARVKRRTLEDLQEQAVARDASVKAEAARWVEPARAAVAATREYVERALPFAVEARLDALDQITAQLDRAEPDVGRAMQRLWRFIEEEADMAGEVSLSRQPVKLGEAPVLADVLRLGMALMYVKTPDGRVAWANVREGSWRLEIVDDPELEETIWALFDAHERNRGFGPIELAVPTDLAVTVAGDEGEVALAD